MLRRRVVRVRRAVPSRASRFWTIVVAVARGMLRDSAARVKLFVSTIRMNVRIAVILSITVWTPRWGWVFFCLAGGFVVDSGFLAFPCFVSGLLVLPLCGAALTFFAAAKKV